MDPTDLDQYPNLTPDDHVKLANAHTFELSHRAHPSVSTDPFYQVPPETLAAEPGTLLKLESASDTSLYSLPPTLSLSRFIYQSLTPRGRRVPVSGYILWPYMARSGESSSLPVTVWAHGTSGVFDECAPSNRRDLWHHFQAPYQFALNGYVVVATDYAGLGVGRDGAGEAIVHEYLTGPAQANDIYYSIPASRAAFPQLLSPHFVVIGSSQGGGAAWGFAEKLASEPESAQLLREGYLGTVALHPATRMLDLPPTTPIIPLLLLLLAPSLEAKYPAFSPAEIFTPLGLQNLDLLSAQRGCTTTLFQLPHASQTLLPDWSSHPVIQEYQAAAGVSRRAVAGPMLVLQGDEDPIIDAEVVRAAVRETAGLVEGGVEFWVLEGVSHASAMYAGCQVILRWIGERFEEGRRRREGGMVGGEKEERGLVGVEREDLDDGRTESRFRTNRVHPVREPALQVKDANWWIGKQEEGWQVA